MPPIKPHEVDASVGIPEEMFDVFNFLIQKNFHGKSSTVKLKEVEEEVNRRSRSGEMEFNAQTAHNNHWFDVEQAYRQAGWRVQYEQPIGYAGENFQAYYVFEQR